MFDCYALLVFARYAVHDDRGTYVRGTVRTVQYERVRYMMCTGT